MTYRCVAASVAGFVQQLAVCYIARGYYFYVTGRIPEDKDPALTDEKIMSQYGIGVSKWVRARRKKEGCASVQYLRYGRFFVIIASRPTRQNWCTAHPLPMIAFVATSTCPASAELLIMMISSPTRQLCPTWLLAMK